MLQALNGEGSKMKTSVVLAATVTVAIMLVVPGLLGAESGLSDEELDAFWAEMSRSVREGDYATLTGAYHADAVLVDGVRGSTSPVSKAFEAWKPGLQDTKNGRMKASVQFRFTQRLRDESTAHEAGIFRYAADPEKGEPQDDYVRFEMLLVKRNGWKIVMEHQIGPATEQEWQAAKD